MISANEATKMTRKTRDDFWESDEGSKFIDMADDAVEQAASLEVALQLFETSLLASTGGRWMNFCTYCVR